MKVMKQQLFRVLGNEYIEILETLKFLYKEIGLNEGMFKGTLAERW